MNYINEQSVFGMLGKYAILNTALTWFKNKKKEFLVSCDKDYVDDNIDIQYMYMEQRPEKSERIKNIGWEEEIHWGIFDEEYFKMKGGKMEHLRQYCRKLDNKVKILNNYNSDKVIEMIKQWEQEQGKKYRMQMHSSYDKRFFNTELHLNKEHFICNFFECDEKLIGYSVFDKPTINENGILEIRCLLRKYIPSFRNDICYYIDFASLRNLYNNYLNKEPFIVNMGASSNGPKRYKITKFPIYSLEKRYFYKKLKKI